MKQLPTDEEISHFISDEIQQDWNSLAFRDVYEKGLEMGIEWMKKEAQPIITELQQLLREVVMRNTLCFPLNEQDLAWQEEGNKPELYVRIVEALELLDKEALKTKE